MYRITQKSILALGWIRGILLASCICFSILSSAQSEWTQYFFPNGNLSSEGLMVDGKPDGYWKTYYEDGGLRTEGNRKNFQLDSTWKFYRSDSTLEKTISYREGIRNGYELTFSPKGILITEIPFANNIREGRARYYYDSGELWKEVGFVNDNEEGKATEYARDGRIITKMTYKNGFLYASERINRFNDEGRRTGIWMDLHSNGQVKEEGNWTNGLRNGVFKFYSRKGELEKLEKYEDGVLVTDQSETAILDIRKEYDEEGRIRVVGSYRDGKKHGTFREYDEQGKEVMSVLYDNDVRTGEGMLDSIGRRNGAWKLYYPGGELRAEGSYVEGLKEGPWVFYFTTGKIAQKGAYKADVPMGDWSWYYQSGEIHRQEFYRRGKEDGHSVEYDSTGMVLEEGDYIDGLRSGMWVLHVNDHREEGEYADGERTGKWVWTYDNGQKAFEGEFLNGLPVGKHRFWHYNGQLRCRGSYDGGEMNGLWEYFDEFGVPTVQLEYELGRTVRINGQKIKLPSSAEDN